MIAKGMKRMSRTALFISATSLCLALATGIAAAQTTLSSPDQVKQALSAMSRVVDHTQRLIAAKNFNQLPRENEEFMDGSRALEQGIANDPSALKTKVEALLQKADANAKTLADASAGSDQTQLSKMHNAFAASVKEVLAAFPVNMQPNQPNLAEEKQEEQTNTTGRAK
jgi:curli biogenesis system outer membrane secretion channel CsgG